MRELESQVQNFVSQLEALLYLVLGNYNENYVEGTERVSRSSPRVFTVQNTGTGIPLSIEGEPILALSFDYLCVQDAKSSFLQISESCIMVASLSTSAPIFRYDYLRNPHGYIPSAHLNIHASNDDATRAMLACGTGRRGKNRRKRYVEKGFFPTFSTLHFPLGGKRFRPGLEDVLQMLILEFGIDSEVNWRETIEASREEYRKNQLRALIREFPDIAQDVLSSTQINSATKKDTGSTKNKLGIQQASQAEQPTHSSDMSSSLTIY